MTPSPEHGCGKQNGISQIESVPLPLRRISNIAGGKDMPWHVLRQFVFMISGVKLFCYNEFVRNLFHRFVLVPENNSVHSGGRILHVFFEL